MQTAEAIIASTPALNPEQIGEFNENGFLFIDEIFPMDEILMLREAVERPKIASQFKDIDYTMHLLTLTEQDPIFAELARDSRIIQRLIPLLGPDITLQHSKIAAKPLAKGQGPFGWHQDFAYFPHTNTDLAAVMVMLDDATPENGCMSMVRGSHHRGLLDHANKDGWFSGSCVETNAWESRPQDVIPITPRAGGISIHHCLTLHGSPANLSGKPRRGLVFQYRASDAHQLADTIFPDTGLQVAGAYRERVRCTVGTVRLPKFPAWTTIPAGHRGAWNQVGEFAKQNNPATTAYARE